MSIAKMPFWQILLKAQLKAEKAKADEASDSDSGFSMAGGQEKVVRSRYGFFMPEYFEKYIHLLKTLKFSVKTGANFGFNKQRLLEAIKQLAGYQHHLAFAGGFIVRLANGSTLYVKGNMIAFDNVSEKTLSSVMQLAKTAGAYAVDLNSLPPQARELASKKAQEYGLRTLGYEPHPEEAQRRSPFRIPSPGRG